MLYEANSRKYERDFVKKLGAWIMSDVTMLRNKLIRFRPSPTFVLAVTIFIDTTGYGMILPLLPFYVETFHAGAAALGILAASFAIMQFIFAPILGRISDNVGRRPVLLLSILTSTASFVLFTLANSYFLLLLSRIIAGAATEAGVAQAYIADTTSEKERSAGIGKIGAAHGAGFITGPVIGGALGIYGFWAPGVAAIILTLLNFLLVFFFIPEPNVHKHQSTNQSNFSGGYLRRLTNALTKPLIGSVLAINFVTFLVFSTIPVLIPLLGMSFFNFGPFETSLVYIYVGVIQIVLQGLLIGRLTKKLGEERLMASGSLLFITGLFLMPLIPNIMVFLISLTMIGSGSGIMRTIIPSFISKNPR